MFDPGCADGDDPLLRSVLSLIRAAEWICHVYAACPLAGADPQIAVAIRAMYGSRKTERPLAVEIRDRLGQWLADEDFAVRSGSGQAGLGAVAAGAGDGLAAGGEAD